MQCEVNEASFPVFKNATMPRTNKSDDNGPAAKRARREKRAATDDSDSEDSTASDGFQCLIDPDSAEEEAVLAVDLKTVSDDDIAARQSSSVPSLSPLKQAVSGEIKSTSVKISESEFVKMNKLTVCEDALALLKKDTVHLTDSSTTVKGAMDSFKDRLKKATSGTFDFGGNQSQRHSKTGSASKKYDTLLAFDESKYKLLKKALKYMEEMVSAHLGYAEKTKATHTKLGNAIGNLTDQIQTFQNDTAANAKSARAGKQAREEVSNAVQEKLDEVLSTLNIKPGNNRQQIDDLKQQIDDLKSDIQSKDGIILTQAKTISRLSLTNAEIASNVMIADAQRTDPQPHSKAASVEETPPPRNFPSASQRKNNVEDRLKIVSEYQDQSYSKFMTQEERPSKGFRQFRRLLKTIMEASMKGLLNPHALLKAWNILIPDYPFDDDAFKHFHVNKDDKTCEIFHAFTSSDTGHGYQTASGEHHELAKVRRAVAEVAAAVTSQFRHWYENLQASRDECTSLCVQKNNRELSTLKKMRDQRWFHRGFVPCPYGKYNDFFKNNLHPASYKNARHTQMRTQIKLFTGYNLDEKKPTYETTDAIWYFHFVESQIIKTLQEVEHSIGKNETNLTVPGTLDNPLLQFLLPIDFFFCDTNMTPYTDDSDPRRLSIAKRGYAKLAKIMEEEESDIFDTIMQTGAKFFNDTFKNPNATRQQQYALKALMKPGDVQDKWSDMTTSAKPSQKQYAAMKWTEYFILNLTRLQNHSKMAVQCHLDQCKPPVQYTPLQNTPLVQAAFDYSPTTFEALVAEASALN